MGTQDAMGYGFSANISASATSTVIETSSEVISYNNYGSPFRFGKSVGKNGCLTLLGELNCWDLSNAFDLYGDYGIAGQLKGSASAVSIYGHSGSYNDQSGQIRGDVGARADLNWSDMITVVSNSLPIGTDIEIEFSFSLHSILSITPGSPVPSGNNQAFASGDLNGISTAVGMISDITKTDGVSLNDSDPQSTTSGYDPSCSCVVASKYEVLRQKIFIPVGQSSPITGNLRYGVNAHAFEGFPFSSSTVDASHTAVFGINVLTPGASYTSASGTVYLTDADTQAIPEPLTLLGAGTALGLGTFFKRKLAKKPVRAT